jgi:hypothetical protein
MINIFCGSCYVNFVLQRKKWIIYYYILVIHPNCIVLKNKFVGNFDILEGEGTYSFRSV